MGQVSTVWQTKTHKPILRLQQRSKSSKVCRRTRIRLDIDAPLCWVEIERLERPHATQLLQLVDPLVTAVVPGVGQTLRVLVGQNRSVGFHRRTARQVFAGDELETGKLAPCFFVDDGLNGGVCFREGCVQIFVLCEMLCDECEDDGKGSGKPDSIRVDVSRLSMPQHENQMSKSKD